MLLTLSKKTLACVHIMIELPNLFVSNFVTSACFLVMSTSTHTKNLVRKNALSGKRQKRMKFINKSFLRFISQRITRNSHFPVKCEMKLVTLN